MQNDCSKEKMIDLCSSGEELWILQCCVTVRRLTRNWSVFRHLTFRTLRLSDHHQKLRQVCTFTSLSSSKFWNKFTTLTITSFIYSQILEHSFDQSGREDSRIEWWHCRLRCLKTETLGRKIAFSLSLDLVVEFLQYRLINSLLQSSSRSRLVVLQ